LLKIIKREKEEEEEGKPFVRSLHCYKRRKSNFNIRVNVFLNC